MYIKIRLKFIFTCLLALLWTIGCFIIDKAWYLSLVQQLGKPIAIFIVIGIAILPGVMICFFSLNGLIFDKPKHHPINRDNLKPLTILIAAYNEEDCIYSTIESISKQDYPHKLKVIVINNNSKDNTKKEIMRAKKDFTNLDILYVFENTQGKHAALNTGLIFTYTDYYITIDADTYLYKDAIIKLANYMTIESKNKNIAAIAGTVLVRNSRVNLLTQLQEWEYFLSIATIKRSQGLFQTTMVAQGAFSIYNTKLIKIVGGYRDVIAEDIALTWDALDTKGKEYRTYYCDNAIAFTNVPTTFKAFVRQRKRWARGSIEGFKIFNFSTCKNWYTKFYMLVNYINIIGEISTTFIFIPGVILALFFHNYLLVGKCTLILMIANLFIYLWMWYKQLKYVFEPMGLKVRRHYGAFIIYVLCYAMILAPICLSGYSQEIFNKDRNW